MALSYRTVGVREFIYEDRDGDRYRVRITLDGNGESYKESTQGDGPKVNGTRTTFTVDNDSLTLIKSAHVSRLCQDAIYDTNSTLETVLNV